MNAVVARPYVRRRRERRAVWLLEALALWAAAAWLAGAVDGRFASGPGGDLVAGTWLRVGTVMACWIGLLAHGRVLRGSYRAVWSLLPVDAAAVVRETLADGGRQVLVLAVAASVVVLPTAWRLGVAAWGVGALGMLGLAVASWLASARALLFAVSAAEDPRWHGVLDALRGANPRPQAAILWSLGPVVLGIGVAMVGVSEAVVAVASGAGLSARVGVSVVLPWALAGLMGWGMDGVARASWRQATPVLEEIRARYAAVENAETALRVPLDGQAPRLPAGVRPWFLSEVRYGWRARRGAVNAAWAVAVVAVAMGWTDDPSGPWRAGWVAACIALLPGRVPVLGAVETGPYLRRWLADRPARRVVARALAVIGWSTAPLAVVAVAVAVRAGSGAWVTLGLAIGGVVLTAGVSAGAAQRQALTGYTAAAVVGAAVALGLAIGGTA